MLARHNGYFHGRLARCIKWRACDVGEAKEGLENELCYDYNYELCSFSNLSFTSPTSQLILQPFRRFTYVTALSPSLPLLYPRHSSFSHPSFASPTSQALHLIHLASCPWFFHAHSNQCNLLFIFCFFFQEKQLSLTETIKYEINKYMFKFIIFNYFCSEITNLTESKSRRWTPLVTSAVLKPSYSSGTIRT